MLNINQFPSDESGWVKPRPVETPPESVIAGVEVKQKRKRRTKAEIEAERLASEGTSAPVPPAPRETIHLVPKDEPADLPVAPAPPRVAGVVGMAGTLCYIGTQVYMVVHRDEELLLLKKHPG